jgi:hypothetical protein
MLGAFPKNEKDRVNRLLDSGFEPRSSPMIIESMAKILNEYMTRYVEKMWIRIPHSTTVFCTADPLGILEENEVFLGFSRPIQHPITGMEEFCLDGIDVLVGRNPAYLASDIQVRRAVYKHELRHFKNVIIFSTKGTASTASMLSGGDYDGDTVTTIWDPAIVQSFQPLPVPRLPDEKQCGMIQKSRKLQTVFSCFRSPDKALNDFMSGCILFNTCSSFMGMCSAEHEKLVYSLSLNNRARKLSHAGPIKLAALAGYLVDSNKQGWLLDEKSWHAFRREASGKRQLPEPGFKSNNSTFSLQGKTRSNIIDSLKFDIAGREKLRVLEEFTREFPTRGTYDSTLSDLWRSWEGIARQEKSRASSNLVTQSFGAFNDLKANADKPSRTLADLLLDGEHSLKNQVKAVEEAWTALSQDDRQDFSTKISTIFDQFRSISPHETGAEVLRFPDCGRSQPFSDWSLLRASCLYFHLYSRGRHRPWVWLVAGEELCCLKAKQAPSVTVRRDMYELTRVDPKAVKRKLDGSQTRYDDDTEDDGDDLDGLVGQLREIPFFTS